MSGSARGRTIPWDWYAGTIPDNVAIAEDAYVETSFSCALFRSERTVGARLGRGASAYLGTMFDVGPGGEVSLGEFALVHGARIVCDDAVEIGEYAMISWNVVLMDSYRLARDPWLRRRQLEAVAAGAVPRRLPDGGAEARPVRVGRNAWIGFDACVLPGVTIGEGAVVGARSVVLDDVPAYCVAVGNPARVIRTLDPDERGGVHD
jgi:acetyltransferase-like isoleucine patch superfamily enzyme